jgi:hypothetical protein
MHKYAFHRTLAMFALAALALAALPNGRALAAPQPIYADSLATSWADWSFTAHDLQATAPIHSGSKSISVTYGAWQGLFLHHPGIATVGFTKLTFFIHGGAAGGQKLQLYATRASETGSTHGPEVTLPQPAANTWIEMQVPLANLGAAGATITGLTWQDATGGAQPTLYIDDIALASDESPDGPSFGGFIAAHGAIAYAPPAAPSGLAVSTVTGPTVALYWNPNGEEDLWGCRISYQPSGGPASSIDVVRATQSSILLPRAGSWRITIAAYDAMGRLGPSSAAVTATTTSNASQIVVPLVRR